MAVFLLLYMYNIYINFLFILFLQLFLKYIRGLNVISSVIDCY